MQVNVLEAKNQLSEIKNLIYTPTNNQHKRSETMIRKILQVLRRASPLAVAVALLFHGGDDASAAQAVVSGEFVGAIPDSDPSDPPGARPTSW